MTDREESNRRYRAGLCVTCGEKPPSAGRPRCDACHRAYVTPVAVRPPEVAPAPADNLAGLFDSPSVGDLFPGLFGRGCRETRYGYVTDEEYERRAAEYSAKLDARDACHLCDHDGYRPNMRVCNHIDYGDGSPYREARKRQLQIIEGGDA